MRADILAWSVPVLFSAFGLCFCLLAKLHRSLAWWSGSFFVAALGFGMTVVPTAPDAVLKPVTEDTMFLLALAGANVAFAVRAGRAPNWPVLALLVALGTLGAALALALLGSATFEVISIQSACAALMLWAAYGIRRDGVAMSPLLFWLCIVIGLSLSFQNVLLLAAPPEGMTVATWRETTWGFVFQLNGAATGVLLATCVILTTTLDIIARLREESSIDALTGILNRRGFEHAVDEMRRRTSPATPLALVVADLDRFKSINDGFGHEAGDAVLCGFGALCTGIVGKRGCVARLGGEEFAVVASNFGLSEAVHLANVLRTAATEIRWPGKLAEIRVSASFGVVLLNPDETLFDAIDRADALLYRAKAGGRNTVMSDMPAPASPSERRPLPLETPMAVR